MFPPNSLFPTRFTPARLTTFRRRLGSVVLLAGLLALSACGHPTPYQAASQGGTSQGFVDQAIGEDRYRVTFSGNNRTPRAVVEDYLLYRAAELTLQHGYDQFQVVESNTLRKAAKIPTYIEDIDPYTGYRSTRYDVIHDGYFDRFGPSYSAATTEERARYTAIAIIELHRGLKPEGDPKPEGGPKLGGDKSRFDARQVLDRIGPGIERPSGD